MSIQNFAQEVYEASRNVSQVFVFKSTTLICKRLSACSRSPSLPSWHSTSVMESAAVIAFESILTSNPLDTSYECDQQKECRTSRRLEELLY